MNATFKQNNYPADTKKNMNSTKAVQKKSKPSKS